MLLPPDTALVMLIQFRYQRAKLYRQVAMGEKHHLTVSQGERTINLALYAIGVLSKRSA